MGSLILLSLDLQSNGMQPLPKNYQMVANGFSLFGLSEFFGFVFGISSSIPVHFLWLFLQEFFEFWSSRTHGHKAANTSRLPNLYRTVGEFLWANGTPESEDLLLCSFLCNK